MEAVPILWEIGVIPPVTPFPHKADDVIVIVEIVTENATKLKKRSARCAPDNRLIVLNLELDDISGLDSEFAAQLRGQGNGMTSRDFRPERFLRLFGLLHRHDTFSLRLLKKYTGFLSPPHRS